MPFPAREAETTGSLLELILDLLEAGTDKYHKHGGRSVWASDLHRRHQDPPVWANSFYRHYQI
jgi:hypothetical protein